MLKFIYENVCKNFAKKNPLKKLSGKNCYEKEM